MPLCFNLIGEEVWHEYNPFNAFIVPKDSRFRLKIPVETAYLCLYK